MSEEQSSTPSKIALQDSKDGSIKENSGTIAQGGNAEVHDRTGLYLAIIAALFAAMSFGFSIGMPAVYEARMDGLKDRVNLAERQAALAREDVRILQLAMSRRGIETDEHAEESK